MDSREIAILKTLLYSNLFDYPLQEEELYNFLIAKKINKSEFSKVLKNARIPINENDGFFFLKGNKKIVSIRKTREKFSLEKLNKAKKIIKWLSLIPTIKLIGISGTLAMRNCEKDDDIDIFVISKNGLAWTTRFLTAIILIGFGVYRNKNSRRHKDKICLNLVLDEDEMFFEQQDLFTAHEIVQLLPIFERDGIYKKFISKNGWVKKFLPNVYVEHQPIYKKQNSNFNKLFILICKIMFLEKILRRLQLFYMRKSITKERLEKGFIGLHPFDYKAYVLEKYNAEINKFGLK